MLLSILYYEFLPLSILPPEQEIAVSGALDQFKNIINDVIEEGSFEKLINQMNDYANNDRHDDSYIGNVSGASDKDTQLLEELFQGNLTLNIDGVDTEVTILIKREDVDGDLGTGDANGREMAIYLTTDDLQKNSWFGNDYAPVYVSVFSSNDDGETWSEKRVLFEKTLNRVEQYVRDYEIAIITAWRNQFINAKDKTDRPTHIKTEKGQRGKKIDTQIPFDDGEQYTTVEKKYYNKQLQATLLNYGYGVTKVRGRWHEELSNPNSDGEESFFVVNLPRKDGTVDKNFKQHIFELSEKRDKMLLLIVPKVQQRAMLLELTMLLGLVMGKALN